MSAMSWSESGVGPTGRLTYFMPRSVTVLASW